MVEYTAFSENKISKSLVMDYIIHIVTKNREPRIQVYFMSTLLIGIKQFPNVHSLCKIFVLTLKDAIVCGLPPFCGSGCSDNKARNVFRRWKF